MSALLTAPKLVLSRKHNGMRMEPEEFDSISVCNENWSYELINGVLVVNPIPFALETGPNQELGYHLLRYRETHPQGSCLDLTLPEQYVRTSKNRRRADRLIWTGLGRIPDWRTELPSIVTEFVSARSRDKYRDYVEKRAEYMELGIAQYWIIDRFRRIMTLVFRQRKAIVENVIHEHEAITSSLLPGFELPLAQLLAVSDSMKAVMKKRRRTRKPE